MLETNNQISICGSCVMSQTLAQIMDKAIKDGHIDGHIVRGKYFFFLTFAPHNVRHIQYVNDSQAGPDM